MTVETDYDVIVAGYGLAGETATSLLARLGHRVVAFERYPQLYGLPRTVSFDGESQRIVDKAADHAAATRESTECNVFEIMDADHNLILVRRWNDDKVCGFYDRVSFYHPLLEEALDEGARRHGAQIDLGWEVVGVVDHGDHVAVTVREHEAADEPPLVNPAERTVTAKYLVGADGSKSTVREFVGAQWEYFDYNDAWMSVDVLRTGPGADQFDEHHSKLIISPERVIAAIPIGSRRIRFEFLLGGDPADHELLSEDDSYDFLQESWGIERGDFEIYRSVVYPFEGRMSDVWRKGRVLLAGDAAHLMPPFTGMGAVSAFRDAANLSWKIDFVLRGVAPEALLETYEVERMPNTLYYINYGVGMGKMFAIDDPKAAAERDAAMRAGGQAFQPDPEYDVGILHMGDDGPVRPAGMRAPMGVVRRGDDEARFDDLVGWGFAIVVRGGDPGAALSDAQRAALAEIGCSLTQLGVDGPGGVLETDQEYERWFTQHDVIGLVQRPDFRVFAGIRALDDIPGLVDDLLGQLGVGVPA